MRNLRSFAVLLTALTILSACGGSEEVAPREAFRFIVYPGSRYLGELTQATLSAHRVIKPNQEPPATAIYDSEAPLETVVAFYAKEYGYTEAAPGTPPDRPGTYTYRDGDLATDNKGIEELLKKLNMPTDVSKAVGSYRAAYLPPRDNRPRVTIQRPYFDAVTSQVVDRTLILMSQ